MLRNILILILCALLLGCGFHLRGFNDMPPWLRAIGIIVQEGNKDLGPLLKDQFEAYNIAVASNPTDAQYLLLIESDSIQQQMTHVAASTAPRQYLLIYQVKFSLIKTKSVAIIPSGEVVVTRQLTVNSNRILGSNFEETQLLSEMRREAAEQIMNRISRVKKKGM